MNGMALKSILIHPDPRLKSVADPVSASEVDKALRRLADDMLETMYDAPGIGLAAPQVGVGKRLLVMDCVKEENTPPRPMVLINPAVTWSSENLNTYEEGCLSIPEQYADVERPAEVEVIWIDLEGVTHTERFGGCFIDNHSTHITCHIPLIISALYHFQSHGLNKIRISNH